MAESNAKKSGLQLYESEPSKDFKEYLLVRCPHEDCPSHQSKGVKPFLVHRATWMKVLHSTLKPDVVLVGRSCPYCMKTSRVR